MLRNRQDLHVEVNLRLKMEEVFVMLKLLDCFSTVIVILEINNLNHMDLS